jgi:hypothetical protein
MAANWLTIAGYRWLPLACIFFPALVVGDLARGNDLVGILLTGPRVGTVGEQVAFEVELVNRSGQPLSQLRVIDYFDKGFRHAASASPIEQKGTIDLAAGTSRRLTLEFQLVEAGRHCHRVEILNQSNQAVGNGTACIEAIPAGSPAAKNSGGQVTSGAVGQQPASGPEASGPPPVATPRTPIANNLPLGAGLASPPSGQLNAGGLPQPNSGTPQMPEATRSGPQASPGGPLVSPGVSSGVFPEQTTGGSPQQAAAGTNGQGGTAPPWQNGLAGQAAAQSGQPLTPPRATLPNMAALATAPQSKAAFEVSLKGPAELKAGDIAEFIVTIRNIGTSGSAPASLEVSWDSSLTPLEASDGYTLGRDKASWSIAEIVAGGEASRQINFRGVAAAGGGGQVGTRACVRTVLGGLPGGGMVADEACVIIRSGAPPPRTPAEAGLQLSLADLDDPVRFGGATTLICTIRNDGDRPTGPLDLTISLPEEARIVGNPIPSRVRIDGLRVSFDGITSLPPGGRSTFEVVYRMAGESRGQATAIATGEELDGKLEAVCTTTFLGP